MNAKIDFKEFDKYKAKFKEFASEFDKFLLLFLLQNGERVIAKTKPKTPVDTGSLRNAWGLETGNKKVEAVKGRVANRNSKSYAQTRSFHQVIRSGGVSWSGTGKDICITINNPMEYATFIEYGHRVANSDRWVEGKYMLKTSIASVWAALPQRFESDFKRFVKELGIE